MDRGSWFVVRGSWFVVGGLRLALRQPNERLHASHKKPRQVTQAGFWFSNSHTGIKPAGESECVMNAHTGLFHIKFIGCTAGYFSVKECRVDRRALRHVVVCTQRHVLAFFGCPSAVDNS